MHSVDEILRDAGARLGQSLTTEPNDRSIAAETEFRCRVRRRQLFSSRRRSCDCRGLSGWGDRGDRARGSRPRSPLIRVRSIHAVR